MQDSQLHENGYFRRVVAGALALVTHPDHRPQSGGIAYYKKALFVPFISVLIGIALAALASLINGYFRNTMLAAGVVVLGFVIFFRGIIHTKHYKPKFVDLGIFFVLFGALDALIARAFYMPIMLAIFVGALTIVFASGIGKDKPLTLPEDELCGAYKNEEVFFLIFLFIVLGVLNILVLKTNWTYGLFGSLLVSAIVPHLVAQSEGGVTRSGIARGIVIATTLFCLIAVLL